MKSTVAILLSLLVCSTISSLAVNPFQLISNMVTKSSTFTSEDLGSIAQGVIAELSDSKSCTYTEDEIKHTYDFNPLSGKVAEFSMNDKIYKADFCSDLDGCFKTERGKDYKGSICYFTKDGAAQVLGSFIHEPLPQYKLIDTANPDKGMVIVFANGACDAIFDCNLTVELVCNPAASGTPVITSVSAPSIFTNKMTIETKRACLDAGGDGISGGSIFVIILLSSLALYFVLGAIVNKFMFKKTGLDIIPNRNFWAVMPTLVVAGFKFAINGFKHKNNYISTGDSYGSNEYL